MKDTLRTNYKMDSIRHRKPKEINRDIGKNMFEI